MSEKKSVYDAILTAPHDIELEKVVLGCFMLSSEAVTLHIDAIKTAEVFYFKNHQVLFNAIQELYRNNNPIDIITVTSHLGKIGKLSTRDEGGLSPFYITEMTSRIGSTANLHAYIKILLEFYMKRKAIELSARTAQEASNPTEDAFDIVEKLQKDTADIYDIIAENAEHVPSQLIVDFLSQVEKALSHEGTIIGVPSGISDLDAMTNGWQGSNLILVGARPAMGKCLGIDELVLMYDGSLKKVQEIVVGDLIMGIDSKPRTVLSLGRGKEQMYWVRQKKGIDYRVNESHILSLRDLFGEMKNIEVRDYLNDFKTQCEFDGWRKREPLKPLSEKKLTYNERDWFTTNITIEKDIVDDYYGFTLDGDGLFMLRDGTVTHNTGFMLTCAKNAIAITRKPIAIFSLEMSALELMGRLIAMFTDVSSKDALSGNVPDDYFEKAQDYANVVYKKGEPLLIVDDTAGLNIFDVKARAKRYFEKYNIGMILLDYVQLAVRNTASQDQVKRELSIIGKGLKELSKELGIPVIALSQLNRDVEKTPTKRPELMHLRDSGTLEEDADMVLFLFRKEYYYNLTKKDEFKMIEIEGAEVDSEGIGEIIVAKYRNGAVGSVFCEYIPHTTEWKDMKGSYFSTNSTIGRDYSSNENKNPFIQ